MVRRGRRISFDSAIGSLRGPGRYGRFPSPSRRGNPGSSAGRRNQDQSAAATSRARTTRAEGLTTRAAGEPPRRPAQGGVLEQNPPTQNRPAQQFPCDPCDPVQATPSFPHGALAVVVVVVVVVSAGRQTPPSRLLWGIRGWAGRDELCPRFAEAVLGGGIAGLATAARYSEAASSSRAVVGLVGMPQSASRIASAWPDRREMRGNLNFSRCRRPSWRLQ